MDSLFAELRTPKMTVCDVNVGKIKLFESIGLSLIINI